MLLLRVACDLIPVLFGNFALLVNLSEAFVYFFNDVSDLLIRKLGQIFVTNIIIFQNLLNNLAGFLICSGMRPTMHERGQQCAGLTLLEQVLGGLEAGGVLSHFNDVGLLIEAEQPAFHGFLEEGVGAGQVIGDQVVQLTLGSRHEFDCPVR